MSPPRIELDSSAPGAIDGRHLRAVAFQSARIQYVREVIRASELAAAGSRALVVGGGRGPLPGGLAEMGFTVHAVDPSRWATEAAAATAGQRGLPITHTSARAEDPRVPAGAFDLAYYADTFEITDDLEAVLAAAHTALAPGGLLVYDTVNRTPISRLIYLGAFQRFAPTRIMPPHRYTAARLRTPHELRAAIQRHGFTHRDVREFRPRSAARLLGAVLARRRGAIADQDVATRVEFVIVPHARPVVTYLGHARRT